MLNRLFVFVVPLSILLFNSCSDSSNWEAKNPVAEQKADSIVSALIVCYENDCRETADSLLDVAFSDPLLNNRFALKKYYGLKGLIRVKEKRFSEALQVSNKYLSVIDTTNSEERFEYATELTSHGSIYYQLGDYNSAYNYYYRARSLFGDDSCFVGYSDYSIGMVLFRQANFRNSAKSFKSAYEGYQFCDYTFERDLRKQEILSNTGLCYFHLGQYDSALLHFDKALKLVDAFPDTSDYQRKWKNVARGVVAGNKSRSYSGLSKFDSAYYYALQSISINLKDSYDQNDATTVLLDLANIHLRIGKINAMDTVLRLASTFIDRKANPKTCLRWFELKRKHAILSGMPDSASFYGEAYISLNDSIDKAEKIAFDSNIQLALQNLDNEHTLSLLKQENDYKEKSVNYLVLILSLVIMIVVVTVMSLISAREKNEKLALKSDELKLANQELQYRNTEKDRILGIAAHDLRTPIGAILSLANLMKENNLPANELKEYVDLVETAGQSSLELINEILLLTDLKENPNVKEPIAVNAFLKKTVELIKFKAEEKKQSIKLDLLPADVTIQADAERLRRALSNLMSNAVKFSKQSTTIFVRAEAVGKTIRFSVNDEGIGIPSGIEEELFESFTKKKRPGTNGEQPFGLGLSIVKRIVEDHMGRVWYDSEEGKGSTFFIELPLTSA